MTLAHQDAMRQTTPLTESDDMDVRDGIRSIRRYLLAAGVTVALGASAQADPIYNAIDLGTGPVAYGADAGGNGTITGSNGQTYTFNPAPNDLPAQWANTSQGVPVIAPAPVGDPMTYGNPNYAYSTATLDVMNGQDLAVGVDQWGISGHEHNAQAFLTQQQPDGSWGTPIPLPWAEYNPYSGFDSNNFRDSIFGITPTGQVLATGAEIVTAPYSRPILYLYDAKTQALTNLTNVIASLKWTDASQVPGGGIPNWMPSSSFGQIDTQGRLLVQATAGFTGPEHYLLLVPQGTPADMTAAPEPATWAIFAILIGGWAARRRLRSRHAS